MRCNNSMVVAISPTTAADNRRDTRLRWLP